MSDRNRQTRLDGPAVTFWPITNALAGVYYISNSSKRCLIFVQRAGTLARKSVTFTTTHLQRRQRAEALCHLTLGAEYD